MEANDEKVVLTEHRKPRKCALWTPEEGLIVSPNVTRLPPNPPVDSARWVDFTRPRLLQNEIAYLSFYPRIPQNHGPILGVLDASEHTLITTAYEMRPGQGYGPQKQRKFCLNLGLLRRWTDLESNLTRVGMLLIQNYSNVRHLPEVKFPDLPSSAGFAMYHASPQIVARCARKCIELFNQWGALVSFGLTLWLGKFRENCFDAAFNMLLNVHREGITRAWLSDLKETWICDHTLGTRAGGIFDGYMFRLGPWVDKMVAAGVPLWFAWGLDVRMNNALVNRAEESYFYAQYMPPAATIEAAKEQTRFRPAPTTEIQPVYPALYESNPQSQQDGTFPRAPWFRIASVEPMNMSSDINNGYDMPPEQTPWAATSDSNPVPDTIPKVDIRAVDSGSRQRYGEHYTPFFERMRNGRTHWLSREKPREKQSREAKEEIAATGRYSSSMSVFLWRQVEDDEGEFWRRDRLVDKEIDLHWSDFTPHQRVYTGHLQEWDLCPMFPEFPPGVALRPQPFKDGLDMDSDYGDNDYDAPDYDVPVAAPGGSHTSRRPGGVGDPAGVVSAPARQTLPNILEDESDYGGEDDYNAGARTWDMNSTGSPVPTSVIENDEAISAGQQDSMCIDDDEPASDFVAEIAEGANTSYFDLLFGFFGFRMEEPVEEAPPSSLERAKQVAGCMGYPFDAIPLHSKPAVFTFFQQIDAAPDASSLSSLWDISSPVTSPFPLLKDGFTTHVIPQGSDKFLFVISPENFVKGSDAWLVTVNSPLVFLCICRCVDLWHDMDSLVRFLLARRLAFDMPKTILLSMRPPTRAEPASDGIGSRSSGWTATTEDYTFYKSMMKGIATSPMGRSLRIQGGLVARMSEPYVSSNSVLAGPFKLDRMVGKLDEQYLLVEDSVPARYLYIFHGLHLVANYSDGKDCGWKSFWPLPRRWELGGLAFGPWSPVAETWYQRRLQQLEGDSPDVVTSSKWKNVLRQSRTRVEGIYTAGEKLSLSAIQRSGATVGPSSSSANVGSSSTTVPRSQPSVTSASSPPRKKLRKN